MPKPWRLTRHAEDSLREIAGWTLDTFGPGQAAAYEQDLVDRCVAIAAGEAPSQGCRQLVDSSLPEDLRFARSGGHFIIFVEDGDSITIVDFLHARSDLPRKLATLASRTGNPSLS